MIRVNNRHSVFTIPDTLQNYFYSRRDLLKELQDALDGVYEIISYWYSKNNLNYEVGVIAVLYIFGRDLKWNSHVHALVTEGAINKGIN